MDIGTSVNEKARSKGALKKQKGMQIKRIHTSPDVNPLETTAYELRSSKIANPDGTLVFESRDAQIPAQWSQLASDILISRYFRRSGVPGSGSETSVKQVIQRIAGAIRKAGEKDGYFESGEQAEIFEAELEFLLVDQRGAFNSPVWFNVGLFEKYGIRGSGGNYHFNEESGQPELLDSGYVHPQASACFIQSVDDSLSGVFDLLKNESKIFKYGSGSGTNFSKIRGSMEKLSGGGTSSGLMSFLEVLDRAAGATKSGGTTRRAAKMVSLDVDHPEIEDFVNWKLNEEKKVAALVAAGYSADFNGEAYRTVAGQNSNNSVRLSDEFLRAVVDDKSWETKLRTTGEVHKTLRARELFRQISHAAWACADPGVQFDTTINRWHTCSNTGKINGSNPCSEYMFLDNSACNLASINLVKYLKADGCFDVDGFQHACRIFFLAQDILVGHSSYPTPEIAKNSHDYRPLGLGYANLGTLLMLNGIAYDSEEGRGWCGAITAIMHGEAFHTSAEIAAVKGPFAGFAENREPMLHVMQMHCEAVAQIPEACPKELRAEAKRSLEKALSAGTKFGFRNAQATVLAPTGTIGLLMDCDTTGIEPDFGLVKFKKLAGGGYFKIVNQSVPAALHRLGYSAREARDIVKFIVGTLTLEGSPHVNRISLLAKGLSENDVKKIEAALHGSFELGGAFHRFNVSEETFQRLGITEERLSAPGFNLLNAIGFTRDQIEEANETICGRMTVEGCPFLKPEHLAIFDCANKCGKTGKRFLSSMSHIRMMAAAQPFLSGAISKTVNLPHESTEEDIQHVYLEGWKLGLKAIAVYRDGSKLSQPLSSSSKEAEQAEKKREITELSPAELETLLGQALQRAEEIGLPVKLKRKSPPKKRHGFTVEARVGGQKVYVRTGEYADGLLAEVFVDMHKEGAAFRSLMNCLAIAVSKGLQYGVPLEEFVDTFTFTRFEPNGMVDHENIKSATSVVDFVFRLLGLEYLGRTDFVHVKPMTQERVPQPTLPGLKAKAENVPDTGSSSQFYEQLMGDAPACTTCGHTTVRNGACYRCLNCGLSMGCS